MSNDSWSRIQATQKAGNDQNFFDVRTAAPTIHDLPDFVGFTCDRKTDRKIVEAFAASLTIVARIGRVVIKKPSYSDYEIKVRLHCASDRALLEKSWRFQGILFTPTILKVKDRCIDTFSRLLAGDRSLFDLDNYNKIKSFLTEEVEIRYIVSEKEEIHCLYKERRQKRNGKVIQDPSPFWIFLTIYPDGCISSAEEMQDIDSTHKGANITLSRLVGLIPAKTEWNKRRYNRGIVGVRKTIGMIVPTTRVYSESVGVFRGEDDQECFPKLGKNCLPIGMQAMEFARSLASGEDCKFWDNIHSDLERKQNYLDRQGRKTGFKRKPKLKVDDILDLGL